MSVERTRNEALAMETVVVAQENGHKLLFFFNLRLQNPVDLTLNGT